ncbi:MAG: AEC family transporter [Gammaproteobacteria bacterium]|nr:AEC family transporter [Gammaproteobacteria bacterium]
MSGVITVVGPVFAAVAIGFGLARADVFDAATGRALVRFMFHLAIPAMLLRSLAGASLPATLPWRFIAAFYLPSLLLYGLAAVLARRRLGWAPGELGVAGMAGAYANIVLLGYPLVIGAFGDAGAVPLFILLAAQSPLLFPLTTWLCERGTPAGGPAGGPAGALRVLVANPVVLSLVLGIALNLGGAVLPRPLDDLLRLLGSAGPGCALIALGIGLAQCRLGGAPGDVALLVALKNVAHPLAVWALGHGLGVRADWLAVAVVLAAMPSGVNAFVFASHYRVRETTVAQTIVVSTLVSAVVASLLLARFMTPPS